MLQTALPPGSRVAAPPKLSKDAVRYRSSGQQPDRRCGTCVYFTAPAGCLIVEGQISDKGVCDRYAGSVVASRRKAQDEI